MAPAKPDYKSGSALFQDGNDLGQGHILALQQHQQVIQQVRAFQHGLAPIAERRLDHAFDGFLAEQARQLFDQTKLMVDLVHDLPGVIKRLPLVLTGTQGLDRAISTAGGVKLDQVGSDLQLLARPGVYLAGEMLDWEAPTGGYLLQGCLASGDWAARAMVAAQTVSG